MDNAGELRRKERPNRAFYTPEAKRLPAAPAGRLAFACVRAAGRADAGGVAAALGPVPAGEAQCPREDRAAGPFLRQRFCVTRIKLYQ